MYHLLWKIFVFEARLFPNIIIDLFLFHNVYIIVCVHVRLNTQWLTAMSMKSQHAPAEMLQKRYKPGRGDYYTFIKLFYNAYTRFAYIPQSTRESHNKLPKGTLFFYSKTQAFCSDISCNIVHFKTFWLETSCRWPIVHVPPTDTWHVLQAPPIIFFELFSKRK